MDIKKAHELCSNNKELLNSSKKCACFYCMKVYSPKEIKEWIDNDITALCPHCSIDAVLPDSEDYNFNSFFLTEMNKYWFSSAID